MKIRTDPEAVASYRRALIENGLWTQEKVDGMSDEEIIRTVQGLMRGVERIGAEMRRISEALISAFAKIGKAMKKTIDTR